MSELNFTHSNGNKVKLTTPDTLPQIKLSSYWCRREFRAVLVTDGSGALSFATVTTTSNVKVTRTNISSISGVNYYDVTLPSDCFKVEFSGMNLSSSGNSYPIFRVGTSSGAMSGGSDYKFCQNKIGASTAGTFETNSLIYTSGYIAGSSGDLHTTQATFMKCGTGERWTYTSTTMEEGTTSSQVTVAHPQNGSNALTFIRYQTTMVLILIL